MQSLLLIENWHFWVCNMKLYFHFNSSKICFYKLRLKIEGSKFCIVINRGNFFELFLLSNKLIQVSSVLFI